MADRDEKPSDDDLETQPGDGPYRTAPPKLRIKRSLVPWIVGGCIALMALILSLALMDEDRERQRPAFATVPTDLFEPISHWPPPEEDLPPSTPLAPLLVSDQPDRLAVTSPGEGARSLRRGQGFHVRFNRPMVEGVEVGRALEESPLLFTPPLAGTARWITRSEISFQPAPSAWSNSVRETRLRFREGLASSSGEVLVDDRERVFVLDGAPRVITYRSSGRVSAGAPLPLYFDAPITPSSLSTEIMAYEIGGGQRSLGVTLGTARVQPEEGFRVDVRLRRELEPGARIGLALAPRYLPYGGSSPAVMSYQLAPRPHIEGIACSEGAAYAGQCNFTSSPGAVIEIGPTLRLLSSARLSGFTNANVTVRPALRDQRLRLAPHGPPAQRLLEISGEWEPDQPYEVRIQGLSTVDGEPLRPFAPIAVRSSGSPSQIRVASGNLTYESDATPELLLAAINPGPSDVLYRPVEPGEELRALISPGPFVRHGGQSTPLSELTPTARPNRWGPGRYGWAEEEGRDSGIAVVAFRADPAAAPTASQLAYVQRTDLGVTVRANAEGLLVWVTSLSRGGPVSGAQITVADADARERATGTTDADGVAQIELDANPLVVNHALLVTHGGDRAAILMDARRAVGPAGMGMTPGEESERDPRVATVFTDRGAYRPGEGLHTKVVLREVDGSNVSAVRSGDFNVRLYSPYADAPVHEEAVSPSRFGTAALDIDLPAGAPLGDWRIEVTPEDDDGTVLGATTLRVAQFRQPTFRVDVDPVPGPVYGGDQIAVDAVGTYLFGAPVTNGAMRWSLTRVGGAPTPERYREFRFSPMGARASDGTVASGEEMLGASGTVTMEGQVQLGGSMRTRFSLEAEVTDSAGHVQAARRTFIAYPAEVEVGLRRGDDWIALEEELSLDAVVIDHDGEPVTGQAVTGRVVREGWHSWWEWSEASHSYEGGSYQIRRDQRREVVHTCNLTSEAEQVSCSFVPTRPGTYLLEVEVQDEAGRSSTASRRVYVAGPDEHPDRDPPGAPISVTPTRASWTVGETAELAFESPWDDADALITVEREGTFTVERRRVSAGGQVIRVPLSDTMVPNVFVGVTLVRPRVGPPSETVDLNAPDLRFGMAQLQVRPATAGLEVTIEVATEARPGTDVPVTVQVRDENGDPIEGEVALWAVDEGTLRLTGYQVPEPLQRLFRSRPAAFAWDDLRRSLTSRVAVPPMPEASGDGSEQGDSPMLDDREEFDPTPLWVPSLLTDAEGRATATITLPPRPTEYRVMAVAVDQGARSGRASSQLTAAQPLVIRPAFPRFLQTGDRVEVGAFVHNATEEPLEVTWWASIGGEARERRTVTIRGGGETRVTARVEAPAEGPLELRFDAEGGGDAVAVRDEVEIMPRGRFVRSQVFSGAEGASELTIGLPEQTPSMGAVNVTVAAHPFVGFEGAIESLSSSPWSGVEPVSANLIALAAYAKLDIASPRHGLSEDEIEARGRSLTRQLLRLQNMDGGFERWSSHGYTLPFESALATHALGEADAQGWVDDQEALRRARVNLETLVNGAAFIDRYGDSGLDRIAFALRVLSDAGMPNGPRASVIHEQHERMSPFGMAQLAMAFGEDDPRTDTLILQASRLVLSDPAEDAVDPTMIRYVDRSARSYGAVLEAASRFEVAHPRTGELAGHLLAIRGGRIGHPWGTGLDTARSLLALSAYAQLFDWDAGEAPSVSLDGDTLTAASSTRAGAFFRIPIERVRGRHTLNVRGGDDGPVFFAIDGLWAVPLGPLDTVARGRRTALHRVYETADGRPIEDDEAIPLGSMVRVRLFVYTEGSGPEMVSLRDRIPAGFDAVDAEDETTPTQSLRALLGMGPDDGSVDARAHHAMRSIHSISHRAISNERASFYFNRIPGGLQEYTYAIRATSIGRFTVPPAQLEALYDLDFVARSRVNTLRVLAARPRSAAVVEEGEESSEGGVVEDEAPPEDGSPEDGSPEDGAPEDGAPEDDVAEPNAPAVPREEEAPEDGLE